MTMMMIEASRVEAAGALWTVGGEASAHGELCGCVERGGGRRGGSSSGGVPVLKGHTQGKGDTHALQSCDPHKQNLASGYFQQTTAQTHKNLAGRVCVCELTCLRAKR